MTNISASPAKVAMRQRLRELGEAALRQEGWQVERAGVGKSSMRRISKDGATKLATIRTSQDTWVAFPRNDADTGWATLEDADVVVLASVDQQIGATSVQAHVADAATVREHFDRAYAARRAASHQIQKGRGVWIALYEQEASSPTNLVGAGLGLKFPPTIITTLDAEKPMSNPVPKLSAAKDASAEWERNLTIPQAKAILARSLGVAEDAVRISVDV